MKKILFVLATTILTISSIAGAKAPATEFEARSAQQDAHREQTVATQTCGSAIEETYSYERSLEFQIDALDELTKGETAFSTSQWGDALKNFQSSIKLFREATEFCMESHQLKLSTENYDSALTENIIITAGDGMLGNNESRLSRIFRGSLIKTINRILGALAILFIVVIGAKYVFSMGDEEKMGNYKTQFAWLVLGLAVVSVAEFVGFELLDPSGGNDILSAETETKFMEKIRTVVRFFEYAAGAFMLLNAVLAGYHLIMSGEKEETISQEKKFLKSLLLGSGMILMAEVIVRILSFQDSPERTAEILVTEVAGIINFTLSFVAILAMATFVLASLYFVISFGDEEQTKRAKVMIKTSIIGVIIASASYVLIRFLIPM